jgi:feruloyl esterase
MRRAGSRGNGVAPHPDVQCSNKARRISMSLRMKGCARHRRLHRVVRITAIASALCMAGGALAAQPCESLVGVPLTDGAVTSAQTIPSGPFQPPDKPATVHIPFPSCRVQGVLAPTSDSNIRFEVWLPLNDWNGKLNHSGNGGYGGSFTTPANFMVAALLRGYATTATDMGHLNSVTPNGLFALNHPEKIVDWGYRANHVTSVAAKAITTAFYGEAPRLSYFTGCSDGGHEALMEAQRFPDDYDGIVAGAPANYWTHQSAAWVWEARATLDDPAGYIPLAKLPMITQAAVAACPGPVAGFIDDPSRCNFDPGTLTCKAGDAPDCLTAPQVEAVRKIYSGPVNPRTGESIYPGLEPGSEASQGVGGITSWLLPIVGPDAFLGSDFYKYMVYDDPSWDFHTLDFDQDIAFADAKMGPVIDSTNPDLGAFRKRGGKLILYQGWADPLVSPRNVINYFNSVVAAQRPGRGHGIGEDRAALHRTQGFVRLFMAPGMGHCGAGPGLNTFDTISAIENWVERGIAPETLVASHTDLPAGFNVSTTTPGTFSRPLCPYPKVAAWTGTGDPGSASQYACIDPDGE